MFPLRLVVFQGPQTTRADPRTGRGGTFRPTPRPLTVLINPQIEILGGETEGGWEGLPVGAGTARLGRAAPPHIRYSGLGLEGEKIERVARGFNARVVQHECDHLDGRLYTSRMRDLSRLIFESEMRHFQTAG